MSDFDASVQRINESCDRVQAGIAHIDALLREIIDHLARRQPDVPLHQRGFGVMDEPPT